LARTVISAFETNGLTISIFTTFNIKNLSSGTVDKVSVYILEDLPPVRIGFPDLHGV